MEENVRRSVYRLPATASREAGRFVSTVPEVKRFWSMVDREHPTGCWLWLGAPNQSGYGAFTRTLTPGVKRRVLAHRFAYELLVRPIPEGLTIDHLCEQTLCVRPGHLEPVTNSENLRRRWVRRRLMNGASR
jgi:hypothetical protein